MKRIKRSEKTHTKILLLLSKLISKYRPEILMEIIEDREIQFKREWSLQEIQRKLFRAIVKIVINPLT